MGREKNEGLLNKEKTCFFFFFFFFSANVQILGGPRHSGGGGVDFGRLAQGIPVKKSLWAPIFDRCPAFFSRPESLRKLHAIRYTRSKWIVKKSIRSGPLKSAIPKSKWFSKTSLNRGPAMPKDPGEYLNRPNSNRFIIIV